LDSYVSQLLLKTSSFFLPLEQLFEQFIGLCATLQRSFIVRNIECAVLYILLCVAISGLHQDLIAFFHSLE